MRLNQVHTFIQNKRFKLVTELWYRFLFKKFGKNNCISSPFFPFNSHNIELGSQVFAGPNVRMEVHFGNPKEPNPIMRIGDRVVIGHGVNLSCYESLTLEDDVLIAGGCFISDNNHGMQPEGASYADQPLSSARTHIGKGVWLGQNVCILAGSTIGERSIIGSGSIVNGVIPPYSIAVGAPAKVIKQYCFENKTWKKVDYVKARTTAVI